MKNDEIEKIIVRLLTFFIPVSSWRKSSRKFIKKQIAKNLKNKISPMFFTAISNKKIQKNFAKENLNFIEIETFSFCNRQCWFCPNSKIDRHSENNFMPEKTYLSILEKLKEINYDGVITYSRYNEPLSDKIILTRIKQARKYLPNAFLYSHTNGDYLTKEYLFELSDAGLDYLAIQCYLDENEKFDKENVIKPKIQKFIEKIGLDYKVLPEDENSYTIDFIIPGKYNIKAICGALNFLKIGVNRGNSIDTIDGIKRTQPCFSPFYRMYIDYDGSVMPCCNVRHDVPFHKHLILGNVNNNDIFEIFSNQNFVNIRKHLKDYGWKMTPCNTCGSFLSENILDYKNNIMFKNIKKDN